MASEKSSTVNFKFTRTVWKLWVPYFVSESRKTAWIMLLGLCFFLFLVSGLNVLLSYVERDFYSALEKKDSAKFYVAMTRYLIGFSIATVITVIYRYTEERLGLRWREWMTQRLLKRYFFKRTYYRLRSAKDLDNPDQRIAEDVKSFTATTLSLLLIFLNSVITIAAFTGVLISISVPLVVVLLIYSIVGTFSTVYIGRRLVRLHYRQYRREADFRYGLIRVRDHAESIAFYRGEARERIDLSRRFRQVFRNYSLIIIWNRNLAFLTTSYNYLALIVPVFVVAPLYLRGEIEFGVIAQSASAFARVLAAFSIIITQFERVSAYAAGVSRLESLWDELNANDPTEEDDEPSISIEEGKRLEMKSITVSPPDDSSRILVKDLNLDVKAGSGLLIMGPSGTGKSSILRVIAGLWSSGSGTVLRPQLRDMMFLPQQPYMPSGSLRAQLMYPSRERQGNNEDLTKHLEDVNLPDVVERTGGDFDYPLDWPNILSLGEQQRIAFARLFFKNPLLVCLDEATSALDEENEEALYKRLRDSGITFVSVGHRSTLRKFHDIILKLEKDGGWTLQKADAAE